MRRNLTNRIERLESQTDRGYDAIIPCHDEADAKACRAWWRVQNPGVPETRLLLIITGVPRANPEPWDQRPRL